MQIRYVEQTSPDKVIMDRINEVSFPECERNSLDDLYASGADGNLDMLGIYDDDGIKGFFTVRKYCNIRYLAYFAVAPDERSRGIGSRALKLLREYYRGCQIVVEYEAPDDSCENNDIRLRRQSFYLRNGFHKTGWYSFYDETEFVIACTGEDFDKEGFDRFTAYLTSIVPDHIPKLYRK